MSIEGASFRLEDKARECRFAGTAGELPSGIGTGDWLMWGRWDNLAGGDGTLVFVINSASNNYLTLDRINGSQDLRVRWANAATGTATAQTGTSATLGARYGALHYWAVWRDSSNIKCSLIADDGTVRTGTAVLGDHDFDDLESAAAVYIGGNAGGSTYSEGHWGHVSMISGIDGSDATGMTAAQWFQLHQRPATYADLLDGATLAFSYSRLANSSGATLDPDVRTTMPAGTRLVDTVSGDYLTLAIGTPSGDNSAYYLPNYTQVGDSEPMHNHQYVSPFINKINGAWYRSTQNQNPSLMRCPTLAPLDDNLKPNAWPLAITPRWQYVDSSDGNAIKTQVGPVGVFYSQDYHYCTAIAPGTGNQAMLVFAMHSEATADDPDSGDTLYDSFGVYRIDLDTGAVTWEALDLGGTAATNVFSYCALHTPEGADYTLAFVRQADEANAKGYAVKIDHDSGASRIQLTEPGTNIKGMYPVDILDLGGGCYGFGYLDRYTSGGPAGYHMLVWDSAGDFATATNWYNPNTGSNPALPLAHDDGGDIVHTINSGEATADRDQWTGNAIADGRGNVYLALTQYEGDLDNGNGAGAFSTSADAVYLRRLLDWSAVGHTFGSSDLIDITDTITALKSTEAFSSQPVMQWADTDRTSAYLLIAVLDGASLSAGADYVQWSGEYGTQVVGWFGDPRSDTPTWEALGDNPLFDIDTGGGLSVRPLRAGTPNTGLDVAHCEVVHRVASSVYTFSSAVAAPGLEVVSATTFQRATRTTTDTVRVYASGAIDTATVGTGDFSISGNTVSGVSATTGYVDVTFSNPVSLGDSITASVDYGIKDAGGLLVEPVGLTVRSSGNSNLGTGKTGQLSRGRIGRL